MKIYFKNKKSKYSLRKELSLLLFRLSFFRLYSFSKVCNEKLITCINSGISSIEYGFCYIDIIFNNGTRTHLWNANKWCAWLSQGNIGTYRFSDEMPSKKVMWELKQLIEEWELNKKVD